MLAPVPAQAQDISCLDVLAVPPFLLTPLVVALLRGALRRRVPGRASSLGSLLAIAASELLLWPLAAWFAAVVYFQEWSAAPVLVAILAAVLAFHRRFGAPGQSWSFSIGLAALFPATWFVLQCIWYGVVVLWG